MFVVAEEDSASGDASIIVVSTAWLTPMKTQAFWPNTKNCSVFNKYLKYHHEPSNEWSLIKIKRKFFETDDFLLARKKAQEAENFSDLTDGESLIRKRKPSSKLIDTSSDDEDNFIDFTLHNKKRKIFRNTENSEASSNGSTKMYPPLPVTPKQSHTLNTSADYGASPSPSPAINKTNTAFGGYEYKSMQMLTLIVEQNKQILEWIRTQNEKETMHLKKAPMQLPISFPLSDDEELGKLEIFLDSNQNFTDLCEYFNAFTGHTITGTVNNILKHVLTNKLAMKYSFRGKKGKRAFEELNLKTVIARAVKKTFKIIQEKPIEDDIKVWLKHAPQRATLEEKKILSRLNRTT